MYPGIESLGPPRSFRKALWAARHRELENQERRLKGQFLNCLRRGRGVGGGLVRPKLLGGIQ